MIFNFFKKNKNRSDFLEIDEILFDRHQISSSDFKWENRLEKRIPETNFRVLWFLLLFIFALVFGRSFYLMVFKGTKYKARAKANYINEIWDRSPRGIIYDSSLEPLVRNSSSFNLVMIPAELSRDRLEQEKIILNLSQFLKRDEKEIKEELKNIDRFSFRPVLLLEDLNHDELLSFKSQLENLSGLRLEENFKRVYQDGAIFSQVLGYTGRVSLTDVENNSSYLLTDLIGKSGLEAEYENYLKGKHGVTMIESYAQGGSGRVVASYQAEPGNGLVLFLDAELQKKLTDVMISTLASLGLTKGAAVAVDPKSGGILALQSLPAFNSNLFSSRLSQNDFKKLFENKDQPFFNRVVSGLYPPGSTAKPFLGIAALEEKIIDDKTIINDIGSITVGSQEFKGWTTLGPVDIYRAIAMSSNIFFYTVGGGYGSIPGLGPLKMADYLARFGFSKLTGVDLPGEKPGFIPNPGWKRSYRQEGWFIGDTYNMSIGQGFFQVTPLELAMATAAIANKGVLLKPRIVKSVIESLTLKIVKNIEPEVLNRDFVGEKSLGIIREAMRETIVSGSGQSLSQLPGGAGGKTGTAQTGVGANTHAWFTVFAPYEDPRMALTILLENGGEGSVAAVPIAREVLEWYLAR